MNQVRLFLLIAWAMLGLLLWEAWQRDYVLPPPSESSAATGSAVDASVPSADRSAEVRADPTSATPALESAEAAEPVIVTTDVLRIEIDPRGTTLRRAELLNFAQSTDKNAPPVELLSTADSHYFIAQSGWTSSNTLEIASHQHLFNSERRDYTLDSADELVVPFSWTGPNGLEIRRELKFRRGSYAIEQRDVVRNNSDQAWQGNHYRQLLREPPPSKSGFTNPEAYSFVGAAWYTADEKFNKLGFDDIEGQGTTAASGEQSWVAMLQHYFFAAWIPQGSENSRVITGQREQHYFIRSFSPPLQIGAGEQAEQQVTLYVGPKLQGHLEAIAPGLELVIDYGVLTVLAEPMFDLLSLFYQLTGNWGWAIVLLVLLLKALFFKLSEAQYKSFAKMRRVQPRIEALKERYGDDREKFNLAMLELYKKEKINPMGGCLPILVQIPVFIALYWVLLESVELRHAHWVGWIQNLSAPDPYFILPALNLATMWLTQKLSPAPGMDPLQKKMMQAMPLVFGVLFAFFPAGLVLYWTVNGALGLLQQWVITRRHGEPAKA